MREAQPKRLYRSRTNHVIAGVCGGLGAYFSVDPVIIRIAWVLGTLATAGTGVLAYLAFWIFVPEEPAGAAE